MHQNSMDNFATLESDVHTVMEEVLKGLLGDVTTPPACDTPSARLACSVSIDGGFKAIVVVGSTLGLASLAAAEMFGSDLSGPPTTRDAHDALREITNIIAGNLKPLFGDHNVLGLPIDLPSDTTLTHSCAQRLAHATVSHADGMLDVSIFQTM